MTVYSLFKEQADKNPKSIAVSFNNKVLTYSALVEESDKVATLLKLSGVKKGDIVGICLNRSAEMVSALLGIIKCGAVYLPLDPFFPEKRLEFMLGDSGAKYLITESLLFPRFSYYREKFIDISEIKNIRQETDFQDNSDENSLAYVIYTSGSTGNPKGVQILHSSLTNFLLSMQKTPGLNANDNLLALTTLSFDISGLEIFLPLICGAKITIASREDARDGNELLKKIRKEKVTVVQATPSTWKMLVDSGWNEKLNIKALCGGEALSKDLADKLLDRVSELWNMYGPTETTIWSSCAKLTKEDVIHIGKPIANTQFYIVDKDMKFCPPGVAGELLIGGAGLSTGYLNRDELNSEKFIPNPFDKEKKSKVYRTGDLVKLNSKLQIEFLGRIDSQVKIRGYRIELEEIESVIKQNEFVKDCAVVVKDINSDKKIIAYVIPDTNFNSYPDFSKDVMQRWQQEWEFLYKEAQKNTVVSGDNDIDRNVTAALTNDKKLLQDAYDEWLSHTLETIKLLKPKKILEIGTGGGQILKEIAKGCEYFVATDFSETSIKAFKDYIDKNSDKYPPHKLFVLPAESELPIDGEKFDTIIINSVIQYFPDVDYLLRVIKNSIKYLSENGCIYIGDVQGFSLLKNFHINDQIKHINDNTTVGNLKAIVKNRVDNEQELVVDPYFFYSLIEKIKEIGLIKAKPRRGKINNETTLYHYDVFIFKSENSVNKSVYEIEWNPDSINPEKLVKSLNNDEFNLIRIKNIFNKRLNENLTVEKNIESAGSEIKVKDLIDRIKTDSYGEEPYELLEAFESKSLRAEILIPPDSDLTFFDLVIYRNNIETNHLYFYDLKKYEKKEHSFNDPKSKFIKEKITSELKISLIEQLPDYMIPSFIIPIDKFPLTPNNKTDKKALTELAIDEIPMVKNLSKPETEIQQTFVKIWEELLGFSGIGIDDNFFEIGGHSILAAQMLAEFEKATGKKIPLAAMFTAQTIRQLSETIENENVKLKWEPLVEIKKGNDQLSPLFLIHGAEGNVLLYRDLANRLNSERTVYGIQARGLSGEEYIHKSIREMAEDYVKIIKSVQPVGPYNIGGYCMGGTVAFEIGHQLFKSDERVENIFLLETYNTCLRDPASIENNRIKEKIQNVKFHFDNIRNIKGKEKINFIQSKARTAIRRTSARISKLKNTILGNSDDNITEHIIFTLREFNDRAQIEFSPEVYKGKVVLLRPKVSFSTEPDPQFGWGDFVYGELKIYNLDVAPRGMLTEPFVRDTAKHIESELSAT